MNLKNILAMGIKKILGGKQASDDKASISVQDEIMLEKMEMLDADYQKSMRSRQDL